MATTATATTTYENTLPEWQRWLNQFCENWIFAFLIAMAIRHFCLEAFRIPTASMEPMLYGDPGLLKGDQVVVDKLTPRFTGYSRWDVTVFQFPRPELENGDDARPALSVLGDRLDDPLLHPLFCRNFVKRLLALPGDTFYFANGDLHLKQADGSFAVARKPPAVQEAVWQDIWIQGAQEGYLPWSAGTAGTVESAGTLLTVAPAGQPIAFTQPLRNLYVKPGDVWVRRQFGSDPSELVPVAMTEPLFTYHGERGNLWDFDRWEFRRKTAKDLDANQARVLNETMKEWVGDIRLSARIEALDGTPAIHLAQGTPGQAGSHDYVLELAAGAWRIRGDGSVLGSGSGATVGREFRFAHLDGQILCSLDGVEVLRRDVPEVDPGVQRLALWIGGSGRLALRDAKLQRDLHYCIGGILDDEAEAWRRYEQGKNLPEPVAADTNAERQRLIELVREQMRNRPSTTFREKTERWGYSPATAITVPANSYLLLGDNSPFSWDGRFWGWVPGENLRGRALSVIFPPQRWRVVR